MDSLLTQLVNSLDKAEKQDFFRWLSSYKRPEKSPTGRGYPTHPIKVNLFQRLAEDSSLSQEEIWPDLFNGVDSNGPTPPFHQGRFRKYAHALAQDLKEYIAIRHLQTHDSWKNPLLLEALYLREVEKGFQQLYEEVVNPQTNRREESQDLYWRYIAETYNLSKSLVQGNKAYEGQAETLHDLFDRFWVQEKWKLILMEVNRYRVTGAQVAPRMLEPLIHLCLRDPLLSQDPVIRLYMSAYQLLTGDRFEDFPEVYQTLKACLPRLSRENLMNTYFILWNFLIKKSYTHPTEEVEKALFGFTKWGIDREFFIPEGPVMQWVIYKNLVFIAARVKQISDANSWLETFKPFVAEAFREDIYRLCQGIIDFEQGNFRQVVQHCGQLRFKDAKFDFNRRFLVLQAHYELGDHQELTRSVETFEEYIRNQPHLNEAYFAHWIQKIRYLRRLIQNERPKLLENLYQEVEQNPRIMEKQWFLEKIAEKLRNRPARAA